MKKQSFSIKTVMSELLLGALSIYGGSWLGFLVSVIPLYIVRGSYHDMETIKRVESLASAAVALPVVCVFLILLYRRNDNAARADRRTVHIRAAGASILCGLISFGGSPAFSPSGYYLATAIDPTKYGPSFLALLITAVLTTLLFSVSIYFGYFLARRKHARERNAVIPHAPD